MNSYVPIVMLLSFGVDWLLLMGVDRLSFGNTSPLRCGLCAMLGAVQAGMCMIPALSFLRQWWWRVAFLLMMGLYAYSFDWRRTIRFLCLNLALCGIVMGVIDTEKRNMMICLCLLLVLLRFSFRDRKGRTVPVCVETVRGKVCFLALYDTGNTLKDPLTNRSVLVVSSALAKPLLGLSADRIASPVECVMQQEGLRLLPYSSVGGSGMMVARRFDVVTINGEKTPTLIAFAPNRIGNDNGYQALTGGY